MKLTSLLSLALLLSFSSYCMDQVKQTDGSDMQELFNQEEDLPEYGPQAYPENKSSESIKHEWRKWVESLPKEEHILRQSTGADAGYQYGKFTTTPQYKVAESWKESPPYGRFVKTKKEKLDSTIYPQQTSFKTSEYKWTKTPSAYKRCIADASTETHTIDSVEHIRDCAGFDTPKILYIKPTTKDKQRKSWQQSDNPQSNTISDSTYFWKQQLVAVSTTDKSLEIIKKRIEARLPISNFEKNNSRKVSKHITRGIEAQGDQQRLNAIINLANQNSKLDQEEICRRLEMYVVMLEFLNRIHDLSTLETQKNNPYFNNAMVNNPQNDSIKAKAEKINNVKAIIQSLYSKLDNNHKSNLRTFAKSTVEKSVQEISDIQKQISEDAEQEIQKIQLGNQKLKEEQAACNGRMTSAAIMRKFLWS